MLKPVAVVADGNLWSATDCRRFPFSTASAPGLAAWVGEQTAALAGEPLRFMAEPDYPDAVLPTRAYEGDAAFDLYVAERTVVRHDSFVDVPCGVRAALPPGVWARITGRSSTLRRKGLLVADGVIDQGYRGPLFAGVRNLSPTQVILEAGERVAQLILHDLVANQYFASWATPEEFAAVPGDGRGERGFGSTGG
jgi:dUTP pyrophosphatase